MAQLIVRNLDEDVKEKLKKRARRHGRSAEEEVREILRNAVNAEGTTKSGLGSRITARFAKTPLAKNEEIPELRGQSARPADFDA